MDIAFEHNSTVSKNEPSWGSVDKTKLPRLAFARKGEPDKKSTWGFPHHWVKGAGGEDKNGVYTTGTMFLHKGGLNAAWNAAMGARSGKKAEPAVIAHLRRHFSALGITKSELAAIGEVSEADIKALDAELLETQQLTQSDFEADPVAMISQFIDR